ncbi:MAG: hypothetical protein CVV47_08970 [Spirochaetae bacterium HGW-Spirochaetae-3]|jgi:hypothetical protein|nr:MAG: hypothetical protein CVV47_08970 [Spirochaetae bacterium HGW-Spirochaetae-3]
MYMEAEFLDRCRERGLDAAAIERASSVVRGFERRVAGAGRAGRPRSLADADLALVERQAARLVAEGSMDEAALTAIARYFAVIRREDAAIRFLAYLLPVGVLPAMAARLRSMEGDDAADRVLSGIGFPPVGSPPEAYPEATGRLVSALSRELGIERAERVLKCNVHGIPESAYAPERKRLAELGSIDAWLIDYHGRIVEELARHAADGTLWYEQAITDDVVDFVRYNQEIQGGVRVGGTIYVTKIPYDPARFLKSSDPLERRRLACHCPLAASSIRADGAGVPATWCSCSAGYTKYLFDVAFGEETEAEVVSSVLAGDPICRFAIRIPESALNDASYGVRSLASSGTGSA